MVARAAISAVINIIERRLRLDAGLGTQGHSNTLLFYYLHILRDLYSHLIYRCAP